MPIKKLQEYFESEYNLTLSTKGKEYADKDYIWYAIQRCLGAAYLACQMGASYADVEPLFEEIKHRLESIKNEVH